MQRACLSHWVAGLSWRTVPKNDIEDIGDVITEPTGVTCVVQKDAKGTKLRASANKMRIMERGWSKQWIPILPTPPPTLNFFAHPPPHYFPLLCTHPPQVHSFAHFPLLENKEETFSSLANTKELLAVEIKSSFVSRSVIWNNRNNDNTSWRRET